MKKEEEQTFSENPEGKHLAELSEGELGQIGGGISNLTVMYRAVCRTCGWNLRDEQFPVIVKSKQHEQDTGHICDMERC